ncbi:MAG: endonuclease/exonuclease/phosphatase family protein [Planctomycetaceae bacterium]|nr:endonuclease/exonuclease/phosphatase family protein [Planctomycetaceae bacterium]
MLRRATLLAWRALLAGVLAWPVAAADPQPLRWVETGTLAAAEAHQAAAADGRNVYAVASNSIAKYDRRTGMRLATSSGTAHHLNSAFLWNGRLYCAHSNYPQQPATSQIVQLDPESMRLEVFRDFGEFSGSLTWVVRRGDEWWCNFAHYDADNSQTILVRFDPDWHETGRWRYPPAVVSQWGRRSSSGGIWRGDLLTITDHDHPRLYRLRLPAAGEVLEFVDQLAAPFPGQGIAEDPVTGGLVGIDRRAKRVLFARLSEPTLEFGRDAPRRIRVLTYNIHHGEGTDGRLDLERLARTIREVAPDVVALQEVDRRVARTGKVDQPAELARLTGLRVAFGGNLQLQGGEYGNAVLTRLPILRQENHLFPSLEQGEQRGALEVALELPASREALVLLATHLDARRPEAERIASARALNELAASRPAALAILAGDLNALPESETLQVLSEFWRNATREPLPTSPAQQPRRQIDFVLLQPGPRWRVVEARVLDEQVASDHRPLLVVLELLPAGVN